MFPHNPAYLIFLGLTALITRAFRSPRGRATFLVAASGVFYAWFDVRLLGLLTALIVVDYLVGRAIATGDRPRGYAALGIAMNLAALATFKYAGFFLETASRLVPSLGTEGSLGAWQIVLPIGISFYSFQGIAYIAEVYRDRSQVATLLETAFVVAFFPKLLAGPLVRASTLRAQIYLSDGDRSGPGLGDALGLLLMGLFKKLVIADGLGILADSAYRAAGLPAAATLFPSPLFWQGFYLYAIQIYADFSGYTDLARGSAALLGFDLPPNFRRPYFAVGLGDFWNRWHMSLTQWFREHCFNPLTRWTLRLTWLPRAAAQVSVTLVTMMAIGLWHGATWMFVAWGLWHGVLLSIERLTRFSPRTTWGRIAASVMTFHAVGLGWILFRSPSLAAAGQFAMGLFAFRQLHWAGFFLAPVVWAGLLVAALDLAEILEQRLGPAERGWWRSLAAIAGLLVVAALVVLALARGSQALPFIYGQF